MKKLFYYFVLVSIALLTICESSMGQIKYQSGCILIGNINQPHSSFAITSATNGMYFNYTNGRFLQLDVSSTGAPRIAGHNNQIVFYNSETSNFNAIQVSQVYNHSDANSKTGVRDFNNGLEVLKRLRPVSYNFKGQQIRESVPNQYTGNNSEIGLLAQELEEVLPNLVFTDDEGRKLVNYISLIPVLIDAVKTLQQEVDELQSELNK